MLQTHQSSWTVLIELEAPADTSRGLKSVEGGNILGPKINSIYSPLQFLLNITLFSTEASLNLIKMPPLTPKRITIF